MEAQVPAFDPAELTRQVMIACIPARTHRLLLLATLFGLLAAAILLVCTKEKDIPLDIPEVSRLVIEMQVGNAPDRMVVYLNDQTAAPFAFTIGDTAMNTYVATSLPFPLRSIRIDPEDLAVKCDIRIRSIRLEGGGGRVWSIDLLGNKYRDRWSLYDLVHGASGEFVMTGDDPRMSLDLLAQRIYATNISAGIGEAIGAWASLLLFAGSIIAGASYLHGSLQQQRPPLHDTSSHQNNSFDLIRLFAALTVLIGHALFVYLGFPYDPYLKLTGVFQLGALGVHIFFAVSGYLICGSLLKDRDMGAFALRRSARILPGLFVCVGFCICTGALFFYGPLSEYLHSMQMLRFILNIFVFPVANVPNDALCSPNYGCVLVAPFWTLAYEVVCYFILAMTFAAFRNPGAIKAALAAILVVCLIGVIDSIAHGPRPIAFAYGETTLLSMNTGAISSLFGIFFVGALIRCLPPNLVSEWRYMMLALTIYAASIPAGETAFTIAVTVTLPVIVISLGRRATRASLLLSTRLGDVSYGVYLYHFPIQVMLWIGVAPYLGRGATFVLALLGTFVIAVLSYRFVEAPAMLLSRRPRSSDAAAVDDAVYSPAVAKL